MGVGLPSSRNLSRGHNKQYNNDNVIVAGTMAISATVARHDETRYRSNSSNHRNHIRHSNHGNSRNSGNNIDNNRTVDFNSTCLNPKPQTYTLVLPWAGRLEAHEVQGAFRLVREEFGLGIGGSLGILGPLG